MSVEYGELTFERPGHSTVRIETDSGTVMYIDPWSEVIEGSPNDADFVLISHDDYDHYDPEAVDRVAHGSTVVVAYEEIDTSELDTEVVPLSRDGVRRVDSIHVRAVPAHNLPTGKHVRPSGEPYHPQGTAIGFLLTVEGTAIYFCSDTDALDELREVEADVVIPPIGGRPTMDRHEAADLVESIGPDLVLPVHYNSDLVGDIDTDAEAFRDELESKGIRVVLF